MLTDQAIAIHVEAFDRNELSFHYNVSYDRCEEIIEAFEVLAGALLAGSHASDGY